MKSILRAFVFLFALIPALRTLDARAVVSPTAISQNYTATSGSPITVTLAGIDPNTPAFPLTRHIVAYPEHGSIGPLGGDPAQYSYTSTLGFVGVEHIYFYVESPVAISSVAVITITVKAPVPALIPQISSAHMYVASDVDMPITLKGRSAYFFTQPFGKNVPVTAVVDTAPQHGTLTKSTTTFPGHYNEYVYRSATGYIGPDSIQYHLVDTFGTHSAQATLSLDVSPLATSISGWALDFTIPFDPQSIPPYGARRIAMQGFSNLDPRDNINTPDYPRSILTDSLYGTVDPNDPSFPEGYLAVYTTFDPNFAGHDYFYFTIHDPASGQTTGPTKIGAVVTNPNAEDPAPPTAIDTHVATPLNTPITFGLLGQDFHNPAWDLFLNSHSQPSHGTLVVNGNSRIVTYTPDPGFLGDDTFTFSVTNNIQAPSGLATATITVKPLPHAPVALDQTVIVDYETPKTITLVGTDSDNLPLTYLKVTDPTHGFLSAINGNQIIYTPNAGYYGPDSFQFKVNNGLLDSDAATVTLAVQPLTPVVNFNANPTKVAKGQTSTLTWTTIGSTSVVINQSIGPVAINGSTTVPVFVTTTYVLTATGPGGVVTATATVTIGCDLTNCPAPGACQPDESCKVPSVTVLPSSATLAQSQSHSFTATVVNLADTSVSWSLVPNEGTLDIVGNTVNYTAPASIVSDHDLTLTATSNELSSVKGIATIHLVAAPKVVNFVAVPSKIALGQNSTLSWTVTGNITSVRIDPSVGPAIGPVANSSSRSVSPIVDTIYTLTATGPGGVNIATATVTIECDATPVTGNCQLPGVCQPDESCKIPTIVIVPSSSTLGQNGTKSFTATVTNLVDTSVAWSYLPVEGTTSGVGNTITYTAPASITTDHDVILTAKANGSATLAPATATIHLVAAPQILNFVANPTKIALGQLSTLSWTVTGNITSVRIDPSVGPAIGPVANSSSRSVTPNVDTIYTLTATGPGGFTIAKATVTISCDNINCPDPNQCIANNVCQPPDADIVSFKATPSVITLGQTSQLSWTVNNSTFATIVPTVGTKGPSGTFQVSPGVTTDYTLTTMNGTGVLKTAHAIVTLAPQLTLLSPDSAVAGSPALSLTLSGNSFLPSSIVQWNGSARQTTFVSSTELKADITASDLSSLGAATVTVLNPAPGGVSNGLTFNVLPAPPVADHIVVEPDGQTVLITDPPLLFKAKMIDQYGHEMPGFTFSWSIRGTVAGALSNSGAFSPGAVGNFYGRRNYIVSAATNGKIGNAQVTVNSPSPYADDICGAVAYPVPYKSNAGLAGVTFKNLAEDSKIRIFTSDGKIVRSFHSEFGENQVWDVRNTDGDKVASGVYYYMIQQPGACGKKEGKLVIIQ